jgi:hypothetical protein
MSDLNHCVTVTHLDDEGKIVNVTRFKREADVCEKVFDAAKQAGNDEFIKLTTPEPETITYTGTDPRENIDPEELV